MKKVLVVDDSEIARRVMSRLLASYAMEILEATEGDEALRILKQHDDVELVFLDWEMPIMTGIEFLHQVRSDERMKNTKIVMVTNYNDLDDIAIALEEKVDEYIMLPITKEVLREKLAILGIFPNEKQ